MTFETVDGNWRVEEVGNVDAYVSRPNAKVAFVLCGQGHNAPRTTGEPVTLFTFTAPNLDFDSDDAESINEFPDMMSAQAWAECVKLPSITE